VYGRIMLKRIYMDANAGAPLLSEVRAACVAALDEAANASSVHTEGRRAREIIEVSRREIASAVDAKAENVVFTSGATEAALLALAGGTLGGDRSPIGCLYVGATEHPCVLAGGRFPPRAVRRLPVDRSGVVDLEELDRTLRERDRATGAPLVALMLANNETGVIHPIAEAARIVKQHGGYLFCDAVQALGRIPVDISALGVDLLALSAHKLGGPQGAGALITADADLQLSPLLTGGGQERRRRAGTENVAAIAGFGVAARLANHHLTDMPRVSALRSRLEAEILAVSPEAVIFGSGVDRLPNTTLFAAPDLSAATAVIGFDLEGIAVSAGSACSSGKIAASHVLEAMGEPASTARAGVRVSMTRDATAGDVEAFALAWRAIHGRMCRSRAA